MENIEWRVGDWITDGRETFEIYEVNPSDIESSPSPWIRTDSVDDPTRGLSASQKHLEAKGWRKVKNR